MGALLAALAALAVAVVTWQYLGVTHLVRGVSQGYRLPDLAHVAAAGAVLWLCGYALLTRRSPALLVGPVVLVLLALEVVLRPPVLDPEESGYIALVVRPGVESVGLDVLVLTAGLAAGLGVPTLALLRARRGRRPQDLAPPP